MTIDMHSHWRPPALIDALRARTTPPLIETDENGEEVLKSPRGVVPVSESFDDLDQRLVEMDKHGISTAVISLFGPFQWIERGPVEESLPLVQLYNDSTSEMCRAHPGRFAAYASLPLADMNAAATEFRRAMDLPGIIGAILPGNAFMTYEDAKAYTPLLEVANEKRAIVFIHWNPRPGDAWPRIPRTMDNAILRLGTLDMQASLSAVMMTLCFTDILEPYPNAFFHVHNLGGNIPFEIERLDHRHYLDTPNEALPSSQLRKPNLYVDCNSFGARSIDAGVAVYGADRIVFGTDGTDFGSDWSLKAVAETHLGDAERDMILHGNAARMMGHLTELAGQREAAE